MTNSIDCYRRTFARNAKLKQRIETLATLKFIPGLVTVVTVSYNSMKTISRTIESIAAQRYSMLEHIVIDGCSTDGTCDILRDSSGLAFWISEKDNGISDAFNKGIALALGEYIALINSDDWVEPTHISNAVEDLKAARADYAFGDLVFHDVDGSSKFTIHGDPAYASKLRHSMPELNHPTVVSRRSVYEKCGLFDTSLRVAMDYEWAIRAHNRGMLGIYSPRIVGHMSMQGVSHHAFKRGFREVRTVSIANGYPASLAHLRYIARVIKVETRQALQRLIPSNWVDRIRQCLNPRYKAAAASKR